MVGYENSMKFDRKLLFLKVKGWKLECVYSKLWKKGISTLNISLFVDRQAISILQKSSNREKLQKVNPSDLKLKCKISNLLNRIHILEILVKRRVDYF